MSAGLFHPPTPVNEPVRNYAPGSPERASLKTRLDQLASAQIEVPMVIGGREVRTGDTAQAVMPHNHQHVLATYHQGGEAEVGQAIKAAADARREWSELPWEARAAVFLRAAELLTGPWRDTLNAATMLGQSKTAFQAEIDAACELADFWRFNVSYMHRLMGEQPISSPGVWNRVEYRPLEGFVFAVSPFNFTAIAGNLPTAPALMGNTVVFKPASTAVYSAHFLMQLLAEAGLPPGVINMVLGSGGKIGDPVLASPELAGIHFTGSTGVFQSMWRTVGANIDRYRSYPRIVGETGGKDYIFLHPSGDPDAAATAVVRGGFEYQGQKCSAASRVYVPSNLWPRVRELLAEQVSSIPVGDVADFRNFMGAVIDRSSFATQAEAIEQVKTSSDAEVLVGGSVDDSQGWFVSPTVVHHLRPLLRSHAAGALRPRGDRLRVRRDAGGRRPRPGRRHVALRAHRRRLRHRPAGRSSRSAGGCGTAAGNFYVNDKPTGAVVGQQPFGGARASGTNDKAGSLWNLIRWVSPRSIKETFVPPTDYRYPFMDDD